MKTTDFTLSVLRKICILRSTILWITDEFQIIIMQITLFSSVEHGM